MSEIVDQPPKSPTEIDWYSLLDDWDHWDEVLEYLNTGRCVLILGPSVSTNPSSNRSYIELFTQDLNNKLGSKKLESRGKRLKLSKIASAFKYNKTASQLYNRVIQFYGKKLEPNHVHSYISKLPFPLIINTSPDHLLKEVFDKAIFDYYNFRNPREQPKSSGSIKNPLIYNLFGSAVEPRSLVITEQDRLDFLINTIKEEPALPPNLISEKIKENDNLFLFIGFDFNEWYLKLLLNILSFNNECFSCAVDRHDAEDDPDNQVFFTQNFRMSFYKAPSDIFIRKLYDKYTELHPMTQLTPSENDSPILVNKQGDSVQVLQPEVMIITSPVDQFFVVELEKMLQPQIINDELKTWDISKIKTGNVSEQLIVRASRTKVLVLGLSTDSLSYLLENNQMILKLIEKRMQEDDGVIFIPVLISECFYDRVPFFKDKLILPKYNEVLKPLSSWSEKADAYKQIANSIIENLET